MASVYEKNGKWYGRIKDPQGRWRDKKLPARTKTEAKRIAEDMERKNDRVREGVDQAPSEFALWTIAMLLVWWLENYSEGGPSHDRNVYTLRAHLLDSDLGKMPLAKVTPGPIRLFLEAKAKTLHPQTVNHLRRFLLVAFNRARSVEKFNGPNPVAPVKPLKVPRPAFDFLREEEVLAVLAALGRRWLALFAIAIYTGLRKGELLGMRKDQVDLETRLLAVGRSWNRNTTKGNKVATIPIAEEAVPYLRAAMDESKSQLVFPDADGIMMRRGVALEDVLRGALGRAGIVLGYEHVCRRRGCGHKEQMPTNALRHCPSCNMKLWPKALVRPIRFHDLRHTTASLLLMRGVDLIVVARIMRHSNPKITAEVYGHLIPSHLKAGIDRLRFGTLPSAPANLSEAPFAATLLLEGEQKKEEAPDRGINPEDPKPLEAGWTGLEPAASGVTGRRYNRLNYHPSVIQFSKSSVGAAGFEPATPGL